MAVVREQYKVWQGGADASPDITLDTSVGAGNLLIVFWNMYADGTPGTASYSDNNGDTWTAVAQIAYAGNDDLGVAYLQNATGGSTTLTISVAGSNQYWTIVLMEVSGMETTGVLDQSATNTGSSSSATTTSITTTQADEYVCAVYGQDSGTYSITETGELTLVYEYENYTNFMPISVTEYIQSATGSRTGTWTIGSSPAYGAIIASFKAAAGAPAALPFIQRNISQAVNRAATF